MHASDVHFRGDQVQRWRDSVWDAGSSFHVGSRIATTAFHASTPSYEWPFGSGGSPSRVAQPPSTPTSGLANDRYQLKINRSVDDRSPGDASADEPLFGADGTLRLADAREVPNAVFAELVARGHTVTSYVVTVGGQQRVGLVVVVGGGKLAFLRNGGGRDTYALVGKTGEGLSNDLFWSDLLGLSDRTSLEGWAEWTADTFDQITLGNWTDKQTTAGTVTEIGAAFVGVDLPADARDLSYNLTHWENTWWHVGDTALTTAGVFPGVGAIVVGLRRSEGLSEALQEAVTKTATLARTPDDLVTRAAASADYPAELVFKTDTDAATA
ncbi:MAG: hypothetical protein ACRDD1_12220, partial [Planctomycetia bacterium]